jgi:hypothetical protein
LPIAPGGRSSVRRSSIRTSSLSVFARHEHPADESALQHRTRNDETIAPSVAIGDPLVGIVGHDIVGTAHKQRMHTGRPP